MLAQNPVDPQTLGRQFLRVQYRYHAAFFEALGQQIESAAVLATQFQRIWRLCERFADPDELAAHTPQVAERAPDVLAQEVLSWSPAVRAGFWAALTETIAAEARADEARGRRRLARMLRAAEAVLGQLS